jgi:hypothetical protein
MTVLKDISLQFAKKLFVPKMEEKIFFFFVLEE